MVFIFCWEDNFPVLYCRQAEDAGILLLAYSEGGRIHHWKIGPLAMADLQLFEEVTLDFFHVSVSNQVDILSNVAKVSAPHSLTKDAALDQGRSFCFIGP